MLNSPIFLSSLLIGALIASCSAFVPSTHQHRLSLLAPTTTATAATTLFAAKGFGEKPEERQKSAGEVKRDNERSKYDELAKTGGQEYSVFVRKFGSDDKSWMPCGAIAVPRGAQVSDAIYANIDDLKKAIVRTYDKLAGSEGEFEFGFNLKIYPDDPIEVAVKGGSKPQGLSIQNWISTLLSPVDASGTRPPPTSST